MRVPKKSTALLSDFEVKRDLIARETMNKNGGYEGKAVLCNIILPFLFYLGLRMYQEKNGKRVWLLFFMTGVAAIDLTMSSMMTVPVAMSAVILPNLVRKKRWGQSRLYLLAVLPCVLVLGVYLLGVRGILQIPVVR